MNIQQVLLKLETPYAGHPYYATGNAILHALSADLSYQEQQQLRVSHGVFVPSPYGRFPDWHSQSSGRPRFGASLKPVEAYQDLFLFRRPHHPWIISGRPREAHNVHPMLRSRDGIQFAPTAKVNGEEYSWYIHCYLHGDTVPLSTNRLDGLQLGGARNYGYGETSFADSQVVDVDALDYSWVTNADDHVLELISPYVLKSEYPKTDDSSIPWWWKRDGKNGKRSLRRRTEAIVKQRKYYGLDTVDNGQVVGYGGDAPLDTAKNGITRVGTHSKYGFGEFMVRPAE